ncbi:hypothetical protein OPU39_20660, partial [Acinetobacter nosocomialis]|nr:hypothetical protein [Acinetobacter nosocomialis]
MSEAVPSVVAIDIGTHKVSVLIGKIHAPDNIQVIGMATAGCAINDFADRKVDGHV